MKKKLFIPIIIIFTVLSALLGMNYLLSLHKISFNLDNEVSSVKVYNSKEKELKRLSTSDTLSLQEGDYYIIPEGKNIVTDRIKFSVEKSNKTINIHPSFTKNHLDTLLKNEQSMIEATISSKYPSVFTNYTLSRGSLYQHGEWFGGLLIPKVSDSRDQRDPYRIVIRKEDGEWIVVRRPEYILSASRYKEVPIEILKQVNEIVP